MLIFNSTFGCRRRGLGSKSHHHRFDQARAFISKYKTVATGSPLVSTRAAKRQTWTTHTANWQTNPCSTTPPPFGWNTSGRRDIIQAVVDLAAHPPPPSSSSYYTPPGPDHLIHYTPVWSPSSSSQRPERDLCALSWGLFIKIKAKLLAD